MREKQKGAAANSNEVGWTPGGKGGLAGVVMTQCRSPSSLLLFNYAIL